MSEQGPTGRRPSLCATQRRSRQRISLRCWRGQTPRRTSGGLSVKISSPPGSPSTSPDRLCGCECCSGCPSGAPIHRTFPGVGGGHEEVVRERPEVVGEGAALGPHAVGPNEAHATNQHRHFRSGQSHRVGAIEHQLIDMCELVSPLTAPPQGCVAECAHNTPSGPARICKSQY